MTRYLSPTGHPAAKRLIARYGEYDRIEGTNRSQRLLWTLVVLSLIGLVFSRYLVLITVALGLIAALEATRPWHKLQWRHLEAQGHIHVD